MECSSDEEEAEEIEIGGSDVRQVTGELSLFEEDSEKVLNKLPQIIQDQIGIEELKGLRGMQSEDPLMELPQNSGQEILIRDDNFLSVLPEVNSQCLERIGSRNKDSESVISEVDSFEEQPLPE